MPASRRTNPETQQVQDWAVKNYDFSHVESDCFPRRTAYDHYKLAFPSTSLSRASFGRIFIRNTKAEKHTTQYYAGVKIKEHPETPLPDDLRPTDTDGRLGVIGEELKEWFPLHYEWTGDETDKVEKATLYATFHEDRPASKAPDFLIGMWLSKSGCGFSPTKKYWKGLRRKPDICPTCRQTVAGIPTNITESNPSD